MASVSGFADACAYLTRRLVAEAYSMPVASVRPESQASLGLPGEVEFATVKIISGPDADFGTFGTSYDPDPTTGSTKVLETLDNVYRFVASIQFHRAAQPSLGTLGSSPHGLSALDKACRLPVVLGSTRMLIYSERLGLGIEDSGTPNDLGVLARDAAHTDRAGISITFNIVNREQFLLESIGSGSVELQHQSPGQPQLDTTTIEVTNE